MPITFQCPACRTGYTVAGSAAGLVLACKCCGEGMEVPVRPVGRPVAGRPPVGHPEPTATGLPAVGRSPDAEDRSPPAPDPQPPLPTYRSPTRLSGQAGRAWAVLSTHPARWWVLGGVAAAGIVFTLLAGLTLRGLAKGHTPGPVAVVKAEPELTAADAPARNVRPAQAPPKPGPKAGEPRHDTSAGDEIHPFMQDLMADPVYGEVARAAWQAARSELPADELTREVATLINCARKGGFGGRATKALLDEGLGEARQRGLSPVFGIRSATDAICFAIARERQGKSAK